MNASRYCFDTVPVPNFAALCTRFAGWPLRSPYRSTIPLLALVERGRSHWMSLLESMGAPTDGTVHFEYCVPSPKAGGNASQTDALLMSDSAVWAIEAKWTEPRYATVAKRLAKRESDGADSRHTLKGWLRHFQPFVTHPLHVNDFKNVVYQVLHRAASACAVATAKGCKPHLIYLHFAPSPLRSSATSDQYVDDLRHLHSLLGRPADLKFSVVDMPIQTTSAFDRIKDLDKRSRATSALVSDALLEGPLFTFGDPVIKPM